MRALLAFLVVLSIGQLGLGRRISPSTHGQHTGRITQQEWGTLIRNIKSAAEPCEEVLTGRRGNFTSPEYPDDFPNNVACAWDIEVPQGETMSLKFTDFHIQPSQDCTADYVGIYDGQDYFLYCGWQPPPETRSKANVMGVVLVSDGQVHFGSRFAASFEATGEEEYNCTAGHIDVGSKYDWGFISSPKYPQNYPPSIRNECDSYIHAYGVDEVVAGFLQFRMDRNDRLVVTDDRGDFLTMNLTGNLDFSTAMPSLKWSREGILFEFTSDASGSDVGYLVAYAADVNAGWDSSTTGYDWTRATTDDPWWWQTTWWDKDSDNDQHNQVKAKKEIAPKRRDKNPKGEKTQSQHPSKKISHFTDTAVPETIVNLQLSPEVGTEIDIKSGPTTLEAGTVVDAAPGKIFGFIMSPNHPNNYPDNSNIVFNVTTTSDSRVALRFLRMNVEMCCDRVEIYEDNGPVTVFNELREDLIYSNSSQVYIRFRSDSSERRSGFLLAYASIKL